VGGQTLRCDPPIESDADGYVQFTQEQRGWIERASLGAFTVSIPIYSGFGVDALLEALGRPEDDREPMSWDEWRAEAARLIEDQERRRR
jgi:hypothetical protein